MNLNDMLHPNEGTYGSAYEGNISWARSRTKPLVGLEYQSQDR